MEVPPPPPSPPPDVASQQYMFESELRKLVMPRLCLGMTGPSQPSRGCCRDPNRRKLHRNWCGERCPTTVQGCQNPAVERRSRLQSVGMFYMRKRRVSSRSSFEKEQIQCSCKICFEGLRNIMQRPSCCVHNMTCFPSLCASMFLCAHAVSPDIGCSGASRADLCLQGLRLNALCSILNFHAYINYILQDAKDVPRPSEEQIEAGLMHGMYTASIYENLCVVSFTKSPLDPI